MLLNLFSVLVLLLTSLPSLAGGTDWSQPPLLCVEEIIPAVPERTCLDLSKVIEPAKDFPTDIPQTEIDYWIRQKFGLLYCRAVEVLRREETAPGSMKPGLVEVSWMRTSAVQNHELKVKSVYDAAQAYKIPPHILTGALYQESLFSDLGIADDGGNFSCGVAQINLSEWCNWANTLSDEMKYSMGWPTSEISCSTVANKTIIKPFYEIALTRLGSLPKYRLQSSHFESISYDEVLTGFPGADESMQRLRYQVATSFIRNCTSPPLAIMAKAHELKLLYSQFVPAGLKNREIYSEDEKFDRQCERESTSRAYPLHTGWLLAVGAYNAGPRAVDIMAAHKKWTREEVSKTSTFSEFNPKKLGAAIYKAGTYNSALDAVEMNDLSGKLLRVRWTKMCILQRHVARVVQHTTQPLTPVLADTLEGVFGCGVFPGDEYRERAGLTD